MCCPTRHEIPQIKFPTHLKDLSEAGISSTDSNVTVVGSLQTTWKCVAQAEFACGEMCGPLVSIAAPRRKGVNVHLYWEVYWDFVYLVERFERDEDVFYSESLKAILDVEFCIRKRERLGGLSKFKDITFQREHGIT
ncbi:hypothetical protein HNY73_009623 [Argiope bruennichi]|uniref:Uncharacterized protein n=1 Tax=Argiope bruennichi TaxID=94029 RepID=A0A8T0FCW0_ARGBR|nr:hypothetical protein HNY73_009623 [Argiope bruennichi]